MGPARPVALPLLLQGLDSAPLPHMGWAGHLVVGGACTPTPAGTWGKMLLQGTWGSRVPANRADSGATRLGKRASCPLQMTVR